ncbi:unnamed protein product [Soboliphyme baturini]|uniref:Uncharacterized protein n=1 Tax=Soboliphyme baturini TaxID=241478 RepID=A0A183J524_9BILA|nr:unnamed protein product [Soboliphyme baturini]
MSLGRRSYRPSTAADALDQLGVCGQEKTCSTVKSLNNSRIGDFSSTLESSTLRRVCRNKAMRVECCLPVDGRSLVAIRHHLRVEKKQQAFV